MDKKIKRELIAALDSGRYRQIKGALKKTHRTEYVPGKGHVTHDEPKCYYCVLGVLCDSLDPTMWNGNLYDGRSGSLNSEMREMTGLSRSESERLAEMNDSGMSFAEIADHIEKVL